MIPASHRQPTAPPFTPLRPALPQLAYLLSTALLFSALGGCQKSRNERVEAWLKQRNFQQIELESKNRTTWSFRAKREGIGCEGTVEMLENKKGYNMREKLKGDWYCGQ